jgi:hypothetical protein
MGFPKNNSTLSANLFVRLGWNLANDRIKEIIVKAWK